MRHLWATASCLLLAACAQPRAKEADRAVAQDLLERYNARTAKIEQFSARGVIEVRWTDERGKRRFEQGDVHFLYRKPDQVALSISKAFERIYWLGCDSQRFWWFDLNPHDEFPDTAYVGRHEYLDRPGDIEVFIPPRQLIELLGVTDLPPEAQVATVQPLRGPEKSAVAFRAPAEFAGLPGERYTTVGAVTAQPLAITFVDAHGGTLARAELSGYKPITTPGKPLGAVPAVATRITATLPGRGVELKIVLFAESLTGDPEKFSDSQFDFEALQRALRPERVRLLGSEVEAEPPPTGEAQVGR